MESAEILRNVGKIKYTIFRSYFSFVRGEKSASSELFKDFFNAEKWKKSKQKVGIILTFSLSHKSPPEYLW